MLGPQLSVVNFSAVPGKTNAHISTAFFSEFTRFFVVSLFHKRQLCVLHAVNLPLRTSKSQMQLGRGNARTEHGVGRILLSRLPGIPTSRRVAQDAQLKSLLSSGSGRLRLSSGTQAPHRTVQWPRRLDSSSPAPFFSPLVAVLKAEQAAVFKFPLAPLGCSGLGSALLAAGPGMPGTAGASHLPLELQLRGKLEAAGSGESGPKAKKGRRSRTVFTELQLMGLEKRFEKQKYLSTPDR